MTLILTKCFVGPRGCSGETRTLPGGWQEKWGKKPSNSIATLPSSWGMDSRMGRGGIVGPTKLTEPSQGWQALQSPCLWVTGRSTTQLQPPCSAPEPVGTEEAPTPPLPCPDSEGSDFSSEARHITETAATREVKLPHSRQ